MNELIICLAILLAFALLSLYFLYRRWTGVQAGALMAALSLLVCAMIATVGKGEAVTMRGCEVQPGSCTHVLACAYMVSALWIIYFICRSLYALTHLHDDDEE